LEYLQIEDDKLLIDLTDAPPDVVRFYLKIIREIVENADGGVCAEIIGMKSIKIIPPDIRD
tara:strand:- start:686 stop:868 length:183 start_codon:yes stop_codon:yes gene_type:complete